MKVAIVYDALFPYVKGGGERRYWELARRLVPRHDVTMISWRYWSGPPRREVEGVTQIGVGPPPAFYGADGRRRASEAFAFAMRAAPALLRDSPDVVDCASVPFLPMFVARAAGVVRRTSLVATWFEFWDDYWLTYLDGAAGRVARFIEARAARLGEAQIAISSTTARRMAAARPRDMPQAIIEPGIDVEVIAAAPAGSATYDVVFAGRLNAQKNVPLLLRALAQARDAGHRISCAVIGDGPERARWSAMVQELDLTTQVHFTGRIDEDTAYYGMLKCGRVFAWPSVAEGYGLAPVEAMACGVPVIAAASELSATPALVRDHAAGVVADPDPAAFARAIRMLLDDEDARREAGERASSFARKMSWDRMALAVEQVYIETIAAAGASR